MPACTLLSWWPYLLFTNSDYVRLRLEGGLLLHVQLRLALRAALLAVRMRVELDHELLLGHYPSAVVTLAALRVASTTQPDLIRRLLHPLLRISTAARLARSLRTVPRRLARHDLRARLVRQWRHQMPLVARLVFIFALLRAVVVIVVLILRRRAKMNTSLATRGI